MRTRDDHDRSWWGGVGKVWSREVNQLHAPGRRHGPKDGSVSRCLSRMAAPHPVRRDGRIGLIKFKHGRGDTLSVYHTSGSHMPTIVHPVVLPCCVEWPTQCAYCTRSVQSKFSPRKVGVTTILKTSSMDCRELVIGDAWECAGAQDS